MGDKDCCMPRDCADDADSVSRYDHSSAIIGLNHPQVLQYLTPLHTSIASSNPLSARVGATCAYASFTQVVRVVICVTSQEGQRARSVEEDRVILLGGPG